MEERQELNQRAAVILGVTTWLCGMGNPLIFARHSVYVHCISLDPKPYIYTNI